MLLLSAAMLATAPLAEAQTSAQTDAAIKEEGTISTGFAGASAGIVNMLYTPLKIVYASTGIVVSGLTWMFSGGDREGTELVARSAIRGDYVLTPSHLKGSKSFKFRGE